MHLSSRIGLIIIILLIVACKNKSVKDSQLLFWCSNNPREISFCTNKKNEWNLVNKANPVHLQPIPEGQSSEEVILAAVVGKTTPDIYANMWQGNVEMFAKSGVLIPLDTIPGFLEFIHERCDSAVIKEITAGDGHIYQVPWKVNPFMTIYNKNIFASNGITELPQTYSAYKKAAAIILAKHALDKNSPKWFGYTEVKEIWFQRLFNFYPLYLAASHGAALVENNKAVFNNKYAIGVFAFLQSLYQQEMFSRENLSASEDPFVAQQIVTKWTGPWEIQYLNSLPDRKFDYGYFKPQVPDDHTGPIYTYADPKNIVIFNTCTHPADAWHLIKTLVDKKGDLDFLQITGQLPRRKLLITDPFYSAYFSANEIMIPFAEELPYVKGVDNCESIVEVLEIISQEYETCVVYGKKTPEQAIADAEKAVNVLLDSNDYKKMNK